MSDRARKLLEEALSLAVGECADLAAELLASLPADPANDMGPEFAAELERRARSALASPDGGLPWESVRDELLAELRPQQS